MSSPAGDAKEDRDSGLWRDLVAYWFLGLCNNYGYVVMLSAAHDIIGQFEEKKVETTGEHTHNATQRCCQTMSTGAILLADVIPACICKVIIPFLPLWIHFRMILAIALTACSFVLVAFANVKWVAFLGVICTSASSGIGESTLLAYSSSFNKNVISTWSSGTGGAGIFGAISYAGLIQLGLSARNTMLIFLFVPTLEAICLWGILRAPKVVGVYRQEPDATPEAMTFKEACAYTFQVLTCTYMAPLFLVYVAEYLINQGLFELIYFEDTFIDHPAQYRWYSVLYQVGVFISRSSVNIIEIRNIWLMAILQCLNTVLFMFEAIYFFTPTIWIIFIMIFYEGLLGGGAYVNTFYRMSQEVPPGRRQFALGMTAISDSYGVMTAGFMAMPVHNAICKTSVNPR